MNPSQLFAALIAFVKADILKAALPPVINFLTAVQGNPTPINVTAQLGLLNAALIAALPNLAQSEIQHLSSILLSEANVLLTQANTPAPAANPVPLTP
jgi:hypothetical protein